MADTKDTVDGLLAEFRGYAAGMPPSYHVTMSWADFRRMLDRFEAAHKREKAVIEADALAVGGIVEAAHKRELSKNASKNRADFGQLGDCAKLREALKAIGGLCTGLMPTWDGAIGRIKDIAEAALSAPPRNCDVGTAQEQDERFHRFCVKHHTGSCAGCHNPVGDYTVANGVRECALVWAQMPYVEKEGGAK